MNNTNGSKSRIIFNRRLKQIKQKKMTLIIGFVCNEGIALVSDTKITDPKTLEPKFDSKILTPLKDTPFIVGAAGFTDLFNEFNRKIGDRVEQSLRRYKIANVEQLIRTNITRDEAIAKVENIQRTTSSAQQSLENLPEQTKPLALDVQLPYVYTAENFLDDCKELIKEISENSGFANPIELLIGLRKNSETFPVLFHIDSKGREEAINDWTAIGSGEPFVKMFFSRLYDPRKTFSQLVKEAVRIITFVQDIAKENTVGCSDVNPPEAVIIDSIIGKNLYGRMPYVNMHEIVKEIKKEMNAFEVLIKNSSISELKEG